MELKAIINLNLTNAPPKVAEHIRNHLYGTTKTMATPGQSRTLNHDFVGWFLDRIMPHGPYKDFEEWYEEGWELEVSIQPIEIERRAITSSGLKRIRDHEAQIRQTMLPNIEAVQERYDSHTKAGNLEEAKELAEELSKLSQSLDEAYEGLERLKDWVAVYEIDESLLVSFGHSRFTGKPFVRVEGPMTVHELSTDEARDLAKSLIEAATAAEEQQPPEESEETP